MIDGNKLITNSLYRKLVNNILDKNLPWENLRNKTIVIAGASGLLGSCLIDTLSLLQTQTNVSFNIIALGRNIEKLESRFNYNNNHLSFIKQDVIEPICNELYKIKPDYIFHLASNTHPVDYAKKPIETLLANIQGTKNLLDYATEQKNNLFIYASSVEIYGENKNDIEKFDEKYCGYIDCNTLRACYPEGKRAGEALCQAYRTENNLKIVIPRFCRLYGPTMLMSDTKALSQFIKNSIKNENIVLKSEGNQFYSYLDVFDAVSALLYCLFFGNDGEAYNISDPASDITLKDLASLLAEKSNTKVIFELPNETEKAGFSKATKAILNSEKLNKLGWTAQLNIAEGLEYTLSILKEFQE